ncbi:MAG: hypothetical protein HXX19_18450, partial [Rhodoferax sp.]|nr:hypothetical protein [Rhodoferax sp.]
MTPAEVTQRLAQRLDLAHLAGGVYYGTDGYLGLEPGDTIFGQKAAYAGWTPRELGATPHLHFDYREYQTQRLSYMVRYWGAVWGGGPNRALEVRQKQAAEYKAAEAKYQLDYLERYGPPPTYRGKTYDNFKPESAAQAAALRAAQEFPWLGPEDDESGDRTHYNLVLSGPVGVGKTHLAAVAFASLQPNFCGVEFTTATALVRKFRERVAKE